MFGTLKNLTKAAIGIATTPITIAADVVTLGGSLTDKDEPYTATQMRQVVKSVQQAADPDQD